MLVYLLQLGAAKAGAILLEGAKTSVGFFMNDCKFINNAGLLSGAIAVLVGTDLNVPNGPTHYTNTFTGNNGLDLLSAGAYFLATKGNKKITFFGTTASNNQGGAAGFMYLGARTRSLSEAIPRPQQPGSTHSPTTLPGRRTSVTKVPEVRVCSTLKAAA